jgi:hypothetical protein
MREPSVPPLILIQARAARAIFFTLPKPLDSLFPSLAITAIDFYAQSPNVFARFCYRLLA